MIEKGAKVINGRQYAHWREKGIAFESQEGCYEFPNRTLASGVLVRVKGEKVARRGYFGDIVTSPYIVFGVETENAPLLKTQNGEHVQTAADISEANVTAMFHEIAFQTRYDAANGATNGASKNGEGDGPKITEITEEEEEVKGEEEDEKEEELPPTLEEILDKRLNVDEKGDDKDDKVSSSSSSSSSEVDHPLISLDNVKITFLPLACVKDLVKKQKFQKLFHFCFFSNSLVHFLEPETKGLFAAGAELAVESTKFVLDLKKEHHEQYARKIHGMAEKAGFRPKTTFNPEKDAIARFSFVEDDTN